MIAIVSVFLCGQSKFANQEIESLAETQSSFTFHVFDTTDGNGDAKKRTLSLGELRSILGLEGFPQTSDEQIAIAVLDTGIYPHPALTSPRDHILASVDFVNGLETSYDDNGHGTAIAGIIYGIAPFVNFISLKVLNYDCIGGIMESVDAINWVIENKDIYNIRVLNVSLGVSIENDLSDELSKAAERAYENGLLVVSAVGNNEKNRKTDIGLSPAVANHVLSVGSVTFSESHGDGEVFSVSTFSSS
jgi:subtilisin family serine protease